MTIFYADYVPANGRIDYWGSVAWESYLEKNPPLTGYSRALYDKELDSETHYVLNGVVTLRPGISLPSDLQVVGNGLVGLTVEVPRGTSVSIDQVEMGKVNDEVFSFTAAERGIYEIELTPPWPTRPLKFEVVAT